MAKTLSLVGLVGLTGLVSGDPEPSYTSDPGGQFHSKNSLVKPFFAGDGISIPHWDFIGNAVVTDDYVRLTPDRQAKKGALWNQIPFQGTTGWEMLVQFDINGQGKSLFGDGFALWYTEGRGELGYALGNKEKFTGVGIFFDTYDNHQEDHGHPWVSAILNDGSKVYDHDEDGKSHTTGGCQSFFRNLEDHPAYARVSYWKDLQVLKVELSVTESEIFTECFTLHGIDLPPGYFFGASASTGDLADNHDIKYIKVGTPGKPGEDIVNQAVEQKLEKSKSIGSLAAAAEMAKRHRMDSSKIVTNHREKHQELHGVKFSDEPVEMGWGTMILYIIVALAIIGGGVAYAMTKEDKKRFNY